MALVEVFNQMNYDTGIGNAKYNVFCYVDAIMSTSMTSTGLQYTAKKDMSLNGLRFIPNKTMHAQHIEDGLTTGNMLLFAVI